MNELQPRNVELQKQLRISSKGTDVLMTEREARNSVNQIKEHLNEARQLLLELYEREGWRALGYDSFPQCLEEEFKKSRSYLYRELAAARLEDGLRREVGTMPESHARAILEVVGNDEVAARLAVYRAEANHKGEPTAKEYGKAAKLVWVERNANGTMLMSRVYDGEISVNDAYSIGQLMESTGDETARALLSYTTDPQLADDLLDLRVRKPDLWQEVLATGAIPYDGESVPLGEATYTMLRAWVTLDNAEARAQFVENNRSHYDSLGELENAIVSGARELCDIVLGNKVGSMVDRASSLMSLIEELENLKQEKHHDHRNTQ